MAQDLPSSCIHPFPASSQFIFLLSCWFVLRLIIRSHYDLPPSVKALNLCVDHSISNNDSIYTDTPAAAPPVTGYAAQMMIVMTQRDGRDYRKAKANQRAAASLPCSHPPVPCKQQHLSLSSTLSFIVVTIVTGSDSNQAL